MKRYRSAGFVGIELLIILVMAAAITTVVWVAVTRHAGNSVSTSQQDKSGLSVVHPTGVGQGEAYQDIRIAGGAKVRLSGLMYYQLKLTTGQTYYGQLQKINDYYLRLAPAYYYSPSNTLVLLGQELHAPEPAMYFGLAAVTMVQALPPNNPITAYNQVHPAPAVADAYPSQNIAAYLKPGQFQAVFFKDGKTLFGKIGSLTGGSLFADSQEVFYLQTQGSTAITLVRADAGLLASHGANQLAFWENLRNDGEVSRAIITYQQSH